MATYLETFAFPLYYVWYDYLCTLDRSEVNHQTMHFCELVTWGQIWVRFLLKSNYICTYRLGCSFMHIIYRMLVAQIYVILYAIQMVLDLYSWIKLSYCIMHAFLNYSILKQSFAKIESIGGIIELWVVAS